MESIQETKVSFDTKKMDIRMKKMLKTLSEYMYICLFMGQKKRKIFHVLELFKILVCGLWCAELYINGNVEKKLPSTFEYLINHSVIITHVQWIEKFPGCSRPCSTV